MSGVTFYNGFLTCLMSRVSFCDVFLTYLMSGLQFHIFDVGSVILSRIFNICHQEVMILYKVLSKIMILSELLKVTFQKARVFSSGGPRGT